MILETTDKAAELDTERVDWLGLVHLPHDYFALNARQQRKARKEVLTSWFDPDPWKSHILCSNQGNYVAAHRLWVDYYLKTDEWTQPVYHWSDPEHKYAMVRMLVEPPILKGLPSKSAVVAPRGSAKTVTLIHEGCSLIVTVRPRSLIVISEETQERTKDEVGAIKFILESNSRIHEDFGGAGVLFPKGRYTGDAWNDLHLGFKKYNGSYIKGVSVLAKHRGRHPVLGIIDDPDDGKVSKNPEWRREYFQWLFRTYLPMFKAGGHVVWIQTVTHGRCLIMMAMQGTKETSDAVTSECVLERDTRFDDWHRQTFSLIVRDPGTGVHRSIWPEYHDVEGFDELKIAHGVGAAMAEYQGEVVPEGANVFQRDKYKHGFMRVGRGEGREDMFLDLATGVRMDWEVFMDGLLVVGGGDIADSLEAKSDYGAIAVIGVNADGIVYVLDAYCRRVISDKLVEQALMIMSPMWNVSRFGWEQNALSTAIIRHARAYAHDLMGKGFDPPVQHGVPNNVTAKPSRIMASLIPLLNRYKIRFLCFEDTREMWDGDASETVHVAVEHPRKRDYNELKDEIDCYTDAGAVGYDDVIDALQIAIRTTQYGRGQAYEEGDDPNARVIEDWGRLGLNFDKRILPPSHWSNEMVESVRHPRVDSHDCLEEDPYD